MEQKPGAFIGEYAADVGGVDQAGLEAVYSNALWANLGGQLFGSYGDAGFEDGVGIDGPKLVGAGNVEDGTLAARCEYGRSSWVSWR